METLSLTAAGTRLRVLAGGEGPPVVMLHGLGGSLEWWEDTARRVAEAYFVAVPDLPGHGLSEEPARGYGLEASRETIGELLDALDLDAAVLAGNSMGGLIALDFAMRYPRRDTALVLVASAGFGRALSVPLRLATLPGVGWASIRFVRHQRTARLVYGSIFHDRRRIPAAWLRRVVRLCGRPSYPRAFLGCLRHGVDAGGLRKSIVADVRRGMSALSLPVLLLWGRQDNVIPLEQAVHAVHRIPHARLDVLPGCGHVPQVEFPRETAARIVSFLGENRDCLSPRR